MPKDEIERAVDKMMGEQNAPRGEPDKRTKVKTGAKRVEALVRMLNRTRQDIMADALSSPPQVASELRDRFSGIFRDLEELKELVDDAGL